MNRIMSGKPISRYRQDLTKGVYFSKKDLEAVKNVSGLDNADEIDHRIRSLWMPPYHGAYITIDGKKYTLINDEILNELADLYRDS